MTGRGVGYCTGYRMPGYESPIPGRGFGMGWGGGGGRGWGWRHQYYATGRPGWARFGYDRAWGAPLDPAYAPYAAPPTKEQETRFLKTQAEWLKEQLDAISKHIEELEQQT